MGQVQGLVMSLDLGLRGGDLDAARRQREIGRQRDRETDRD